MKGTILVVVMAVTALALTAGALAATQSSWVDEIANSLSFYQTTYPQSDFGPYLDRIAKVRDGWRRGDQQIVKLELTRFLQMLQARAHGINDVAADELYNFALSVRPADEPTASANELGIGTERPMSVPDHSINTPYEGGPPCKNGWCDYWLDNVFDPGAS